MERTLVELIAAKRDGQTLGEAEVSRIIRSFGDGALADYQMAAFLMAVFFRGLDDAETVALTEAMLHSGTVLDLSNVPGVKVDKHSTGGVGDKVSICLAPLVAACGVPVPMVSGRSCRNASSNCCVIWHNTPGGPSRARSCWRTFGKSTPAG